MKILFAAAALAVVTTGAQAQEAIWDRWFVGFDAGYVSRSLSNDYYSIDSEGLTGGINFGRWWLVEPVYVGFDAGVSFGGAYSRTETVDTWATTTWYFTDERTETVAASARMKVGLPVGPALAFVAAGPQYVHTSYRGRTSSTTGPSSDTTSHDVDFGLKLQAGAEFFLTHNVAAKAEGGMDVIFPGYSERVSIGGWSAKAGVNYYFD